MTTTNVIHTSGSTLLEAVDRAKIAGAEAFGVSGYHVTAHEAEERDPRSGHVVYSAAAAKKRFSASAPTLEAAVADVTEQARVSFGKDVPLDITHTGEPSGTQIPVWTAVAEARDRVH